MMSGTHNDETPSKTNQTIRSATSPTGRLGLLTAFGAVSGTIPLSVVPGQMLKNVRGAIAFDVARHHGLTLTKDARQILSSADSADLTRAQYIGIATWAVGRIVKRAGPLRMLRPTICAVEIFALGHLFSRYLEEARIRRSVRIEADEALHIRRTIDRSLRMSFAVDLILPKEHQPDFPPDDDQRNSFTRLIDWALLSTASLPSYFLRRLDASFDRVVCEKPNPNA